MRTKKLVCDCGNTSIYYGGRCLGCFREYRSKYMSSWRKSNPDKIKRVYSSKDNEYVKKVYRKKYKYIREIKQALGCVDCGNNDFRVLDFDHVISGKLYNISEMPQRYGIDKIKEEIKKCEVVCANCHRIRTHNRRNNE